MIRKVISGGQTGSDRAGLDAAMDSGIPHGGWCPAGRIAAGGRIPDRYNLRETEEATYPPRTEKNVKEADATVIFYRGPSLSRGCALTVRLCDKHRKPYLEVDLSETSVEEAAEKLRELIQEHKVATLNVAGSRENKSPGIYFLTYETLMLVFGEK